MTIITSYGPYDERTMSACTDCVFRISAFREVFNKDEDEINYSHEKSCMLIKASAFKDRQRRGVGEYDVSPARSGSDGYRDWCIPAQTVLVWVPCKFRYTKDELIEKLSE